MIRFDKSKGPQRGGQNTSSNNLKAPGAPSKLPIDAKKSAQKKQTAAGEAPGNRGKKSGIGQEGATIQDHGKPSIQIRDFNENASGSNSQSATGGPDKAALDCHCQAGKSTKFQLEGARNAARSENASAKKPVDKTARKSLIPVPKTSEAKATVDGGSKKKFGDGKGNIPKSSGEGAHH